MKRLYKRKVAEVYATQWHKFGDHPAVHLRLISELDIDKSPAIQTDFGWVEVKAGDWVVEIDGKIKILKDKYFRQHYDEVPVTPGDSSRFVYDCE